MGYRIQGDNCADKYENDDRRSRSIAGIGNKLPLLMPEEHALPSYRRLATPLVANLNSFALDFVCRQKLHGQTLNLYLVEQLPTLPEGAYQQSVGQKTGCEIVAEEVLKLTYTAHDMAPFARDMGYDGPPFTWDQEERRHSCARLDALYFLLYGVSREDAAYILDTFPIVRRQDEAAFGRFLTKELILRYMAAFAAGDPHSRIRV